MDKIAPGLFVGTVDDAGDVKTLRDRGIGTVVSVIHSRRTSR